MEELSCQRLYFGRQTSEKATPDLTPRLLSSSFSDLRSGHCNPRVWEMSPHAGEHPDLKHDLSVFQEPGSDGPQRHTAGVLLHAGFTDGPREERQCQQWLRDDQVSNPKTSGNKDENQLAGQKL